MYFIKISILLLAVLIILLISTSSLNAALQVMEPVTGEFVVLDTNTNLMWMQNACYQVSNDGWFGGLDYAGYTDWLLPSRSEFGNLYNVEGITTAAPSPFINVTGNAGSGLIGNWTREDGATWDYKWYFRFDTGASVLEFIDSTHRACLWAVRDYNNNFDNDSDGYAEIAGDCDDTDPDVNPAETEVPYNGKDDDCNAATLDDDLDSDGYPLVSDCNDNDPTINPGITETPYNGKDDDCNAATLDDDLDSDSYPLASDCNDNDPTINPGMTEIPYNGKDDDCNVNTSDGDPTIGLYIDNNGDVGIGTPSPSEKLSVYGIIESITGGIKFPDGTVQTTAGGSGIGDITAVYSGAGLSGGGISGNVTLSADTTYLQRRVSSSCAANQAIKGINSDGTVTCENVAGGTGDITAVTAGTGLTGGGTSGDISLTVDLSGSGSAVTVARSDHHHDSVYQKKYAGVAVVAQSGGDYSDPYVAMNDVSAWCGIASAANPCALKLMPGIYDIGSNNIVMQEYVDIEGSGENMTKIKGNTDGLNAVVMGADNAEIRLITVENTGGGSYAFAIYNLGTSPNVTNVTVIAAGATENVGILCDENCASKLTNLTSIVTGGSVVAIAVYIEGASPTLMNVTATATGSARNIGVDINNYSLAELTNVMAYASGGSKTEALLIQGTSSPTLSNVRAVAAGATSHNYAVYSIQASSPMLNNVTADASGVGSSYGVYNDNFGLTGGTIRIDHSVVKGATNAAYLDASYSALIGNTRLSGSVTGPGSATCTGAYNENYTALNSSCQ